MFALLLLIQLITCYFHVHLNEEVVSNTTQSIRLSDKTGLQKIFLIKFYLKYMMADIQKR